MDEIVTNVFDNLIKKRIIYLNDDIDNQSATLLSAKLIFLNSKSKSEITLYINSRGGTVEDGLLTIYDTIKHIKAPVKTICLGEAYSSAAVILSAGTKGRRFASSHSTIMIHSVYDRIHGSVKEIEREAKRSRKVNESMMRIIAENTGQDQKKVEKDCEEDKYFTVNEAIEYGLIDGILK